MTDDERQLLRATAKLVIRMSDDLASKRNIFLGDSGIAIMAMNWKKDADDIRELLERLDQSATSTEP